jgi:hypothetical protein
MEPFRGRPQPVIEAVAGPVLGAHQKNLCRLGKKRSQVLASSFRDAAQDGAPTRAVLSGDKAEPGAKIPPAFESLSCADGRDQTSGDQRSDAWHAHKPPAVGFALAEGFNLVGDALDPFVQAKPIFVKADNQASHPGRYLVLPIPEDLKERFAQGACTSSHRDALLDKEGADLVDGGSSARDQPRSDAVTSLEVELGLALFRDCSEVRSQRRFSDRFGIVVVDPSRRV